MLDIVLSFTGRKELEHWITPNMQKPHRPESSLTQVAWKFWLDLPPSAPWINPSDWKSGTWRHTLPNNSQWTRPCACTNSCSAGVMFGTSCLNFSVISFVQVQGSSTDLKHPTWGWGNCSMERSEGTSLFWERGLHLEEPAPGASRSNFPKGPTLGMQKTMLTFKRHHETLDHRLVRISVKHTKYSKLTSQLFRGKWFIHCESVNAVLKKSRSQPPWLCPHNIEKRSRQDGSVGMVLRLWKQEILGINQLPMKGTASSQQNIWPRTLLLRYLNITIKHWLKLSFSRSRNHEVMNL